MIHINQLKVPVEKLAEKVPEALLKRGIIGTEEKEIVKKKTAEQMHIAVDEMHAFSILKKSVDARRKKELSYVYRVEFSHAEEKKILKRYRKSDATVVEKKKSEKISSPVLLKKK